MKIQHISFTYVDTFFANKKRSWAIWAYTNQKWECWTSQPSRSFFFLIATTFYLGLDTTHLKLKGLKLQWVFEKGWIMMSSKQIHKHLPPLLHLESCQWIPTTSWHVIYIGPYLPIHVKYEGKFWRQKDKAHVEGQKKNAPLMSMSLLVSFGSHYKKLDSLRISLSTCIQSNPFQIHLTYFPFL